MKTIFHTLSSAFAAWKTGAIARPWMFAGLMASLSALTGCHAHARAATTAAVVVEEPVMEVAVAPVAVETYPRHAYRGRYVYLVDGHWYYRSGARWVVYTVEPVALSRVRVGYQATVRTHAAARPEMASPKPHAKSSGKKKGHARGHGQGHKKH